MHFSIQGIQGNIGNRNSTRTNIVVLLQYSDNSSSLVVYPYIHLRSYISLSCRYLTDEQERKAMIYTSLQCVHFIFFFIFGKGMEDAIIVSFSRRTHAPRWLNIEIWAAFCGIA